MHILDTDHMTSLEREGPEAARLKKRLKHLPLDDIATTNVCYEEQTRGWLAVSAQANTPDKRMAAYRRLKMHLNIYCNLAVVEFDSNASDEYERLRRMRVRIGTMDLKIAAIALASRATLLTRNLSHFSQVPDLHVEDWSV